VIKTTLLAVAVTAAISGTMALAENKGSTCHPNLNFNVRTLNDDKVVNLCQEYQGKVVLIVNTASKCAFTGQYEGLEQLYANYKDDGLVVLGFPSNDFGNQDPGSEEQIQKFCRMTYGVQFPMFQKSHVKKKYADPLFVQLGEQGGYPRWNFYKYLINRDGELVDTYSSFTSPASKQIKSKIETLLF
jgi:glutathione peroxidase